MSCDTSIGDVGEPAVLFVEECADGLDLLSPENQQVIYINKISNYFFIHPYRDLCSIGMLQNQKLGVNSRQIVLQ